jgi:hypothetical protein
MLHAPAVRVVHIELGLHGQPTERGAASFLQILASYFGGGKAESEQHREKKEPSASCHERSGESPISAPPGRLCGATWKRNVNHKNLASESGLRTVAFSSGSRKNGRRTDLLISGDWTGADMVPK